MCGSVEWRVEKSKNQVKFWVGNQGFTIYTRDGTTPNDENAMLVDFFQESIEAALNRLSPKPPATTA